MNPLTYVAIAASSVLSAFAGSQFNEYWEFQKGDEATQWQHVTLPHTAHLEPYISNDMWMGECRYRKSFEFKPEWQGKRVALQFEGAMGIATVSLNGKELDKHIGGYIGFEVELTDHLQPGKNLLEVTLDNRENPDYPPGKSYRTLDFAWFSGIYRNVHLVVTDKLHISNAIAANQPAGGGIFVTYPEVSTESATIQIKTHVVNDHAENRTLQVDQSLWLDGQRLTGSRSDALTLAPESDQHVTQQLQLENPLLWSPQAPNLYTLKTQLLADDQSVVHEETQKIGVRTISYSADGFVLNGKNFFQRGTNRHQEFPYIGYAASDEAQYRDAVKIKEAGFDIVRISHYPQSPAFMRACDELGLMTINCITGWQFFKDGEFAKHSLQEGRDLIRRDRNHPSVVLWEISLNETHVPSEFLAQQHAIVDEEYPGDQSFSGSWKDGPHDVFLPARQHGKGPKFWDDWENNGKPAFTAEYGDWEYYAQAAANFNQHGSKELKKEESTSRQLRKHGEKRLLQQALNYQESHNQNLRGKSIIGDANWLMFDYNRGYANDHCSSGVMDLMRLPKFAYYFYRSQRPAHEASDRFSSGPMVFAATYWQTDSSPHVRVFSNCESVTAYLNGKKVATQTPDDDQFSTHLNHPPFTFDFGQFTPGELRFVGHIDGKPVAEHRVNTPGEPASLALQVDESGKPLVADGNDFVFVYASVVDAKGTVVPTANHTIRFDVQGGQVVGPSTVTAEAGTQGVLVRANPHAGSVRVTASAEGIVETATEIQTAK
ncbi:glycoside hydrolase family 2 protein [Sulfuriroseicoccus oceanibius]|uniref:DUF4982 domain-containing protein n=1 Tax=Sulfuriroseicoccus oceanibius TaxID=2707525 RepID=A0A6B3LD91_9BACT|nr:glycoside hydrolase family 2 TIM barrel-domain containing protein [Sulfuriroseicoccus oceanibius]QQL44828.1 DUF4982 domain-containing protein [Sulfuriroseicoccus oceanibius]